VAAGERVLLVVLDAFGLSFLERHGEHPLVQRLEVTPLRAQFPSTTTAEMTTLYFDQPVESHGLYEWHILEPSLRQIICPLMWTLPGDPPGGLGEALAREVIVPGPTVAQSLGAPAVSFLPAPIAGSRYTAMATAGGGAHGFRDLPEGLDKALRALAGDRRYALVYWDAIDATGHVHGPSSPAFAEAARDALDAVLDAVRNAPPGVTVLVTADHGQVDVDPSRVDYLDELWPQLGDHLTYARPAGSARDAFLHVRPGERDLVVAELSGRLSERAEVRVAAELFGDIGPRLRERLGDLVVLPAAGRQAWLRAAPGPERRFRGSHGGLDSDETAVYLAQVAT
jgi:predicted AlkP superfamily pyrophosphatase or phosphodiesterase